MSQAQGHLLLLLALEPLAAPAKAFIVLRPISHAQGYLQSAASAAPVISQRQMLRPHQRCLHNGSGHRWPSRRITAGS